MSDEDPFGLTNDAARTRIRPQGPRTGQPADRHDPRAGQAGGRASRIPGRRGHHNVLITSFAPLLELAPELERAQPPADVEALRMRLLDGLTRARDTAVSAGAPLSRADAAAWFVAALLDDLALNTPWGGNSGWPREPLVVSLSGDVDAGTRFFERLAELERYPDRDRELLELAFVCLSLGFRGKYRVPGRAGDGSLAQARAQIARLMRDREIEDRDLSPSWRGVEARDGPRRFTVPLWAIAVGAVAALTVVYILLGMRLSDRGERLFSLAAVLPPQERAEIFRPVRVEAKTPPPAFEPVSFDLLPEFRAAAPENVAAALSGEEDASLTSLLLQATDPEVFQSARAEINGDYGPLVAAIAGVITENIELISAVKVIGHTDSIPVRGANPFVSNQGLSEARAVTIRDILVTNGVPGELITSEGRAATEPIADNATREGRAKNRRVEIRIQKGI